MVPHQGHFRIDPKASEQVLEESDLRKRSPRRMS